MLVVRGTKKLRDRLKGSAATGDDSSTTLLGDWFANVLFWRPQVVLLVNARTLLPVFVPLAPATTLLERIPAAIADHLRHHGTLEAIVADELAAMADIRVAPTNDRSVLGVMNEFAFQGELMVKVDGITDLDVISRRLSHLLVGPLMKGQRLGTPDAELASLLEYHQSLSNVIPFPRQPAAPTSTSSTAPTSRAATTPAPPGLAYQLKITLRGTKPPVWRRVLVSPSATLHDLHEVIQAAFDWWNYHLYEFEIGRTRYCLPDPDGDDWDFGPPARDPRTSALADVATPGTSFAYTYDFGDSWVHTVEVEELVQATQVILPECIDGRRAAPPEDCGGTGGFAELLEILADPRHPEHHERVEWVGNWPGRIDPAAFDPNEFTENLHTLRMATFDD